MTGGRSHPQEESPWPTAAAQASLLGCQLLSLAATRPRVCTAVTSQAARPQQVHDLALELAASPWHWSPADVVQAGASPMAPSSPTSSSALRPLTESPPPGPFSPLLGQGSAISAPAPVVSLLGSLLGPHSLPCGGGNDFPETRCLYVLPSFQAAPVSSRPSLVDGLTVPPAC